MRRIKLEQALIPEILAQVTNQLTGLVSLDDNLTIQLKDLMTVEYDQPQIILSEEAAIKMWSLCMACDTEIGWHMVVNKEDNNYFVEDILVFPQTVTGATVTTDDKEYPAWLDSLDDATFNHLRGHGHSHVNMGTAASGTDMTYQRNLLKDIKDYYLFMIINKQYSVNIFLYDMEKNILFTTEDVLYSDLYYNSANWAAEQIKEHTKRESFSTIGKACTPSYSYQTYNQESIYDKIKREINPELYGYYGYDT